MEKELRFLDTAIIGAGAAGLACAIKLNELGVSNIMLFDRNPFLGGILKQCIHLGFGLTYFNEELTGPQYAERLIKKLKEKEIKYQLSSTITDISDEKIITVSSASHGVIRYKARTVVFAAGCRERTRDNIEVPGTRPIGIFSAGQAQSLINLYGVKIGEKVIIQGSGDIGLIMARRLKIEGYEVIAVLETLPYLSGLMRNKVQCLDHFGIPLMLSSTIKQICGKKRVSGVYVETQSDQGVSEIYYDCDTVLFAVGLIPELELAKNQGLKITGFNPDVNSAFEGSKDGIFFCGNCLHINDLADNASIEGERAAVSVSNYLKDLNEFKKRLTQSLPYSEKKKNEQFNYEFFKRLSKSGKQVCIICPRSCILTEGGSPCQRGETYLKSIRGGGYSQRLTTTILAKDMQLTPIVTDDDVPIECFSEKVKDIKSKRGEENKQSKVKHE